MQTKYDLTKYEKMYDTFDPAHSMEHINSVRDFAIKLAKTYCPQKLETVYVAATLHDIGIGEETSRKKHHINGYELIKKDLELKQIYGEEAFQEILEAILEHRSSDGKPECLVAKIVSDADKVSDTTEDAFIRAYKYGITKQSYLTYQEQLERCAYELEKRFAPNGQSSHTYFKESAERMREIYDPILEAYHNEDWKKLESYLPEEIR